MARTANYRRQPGGTFALLEAVVKEAQRNAQGIGKPAPTARECQEAGEFIKYLREA